MLNQRIEHQTLLSSCSALLSLPAKSSLPSSSIILPLFSEQQSFLPLILTKWHASLATERQVILLIRSRTKRQPDGRHITFLRQLIATCRNLAHHCTKLLFRLIHSLVLVTASEAGISCSGASESPSVTSSSSLTSFFANTGAEQRATSSGGSRHPLCMNLFLVLFEQANPDDRSSPMDSLVRRLGSQSTAISRIIPITSQRAQHGMHVSVLRRKRV